VTAATIEAPATPETRLPPGPPLPRAIQTLGFLVGGPRYLEACRRRYGGAVYMRTLFDDGFVMVFDPALVRQLFQGSGDQLHAGEANALLGPVVGERSVLLLDGGEHLRHRRLLLPPFHGQRMRTYEEVITRATDAEIDAWPVGEPFAVMPHMQALTLEVILQAVFGYAPGPAEAELAARIRAFIDPLARPQTPQMLLRILRDRFRGRTPLDMLTPRRRAVDELLYAEIARRRALPQAELEGRDDVFSGLLLAEDEEGERLTDQEARDELLTLLLAGHETTATGLAWTIDLLLHHPAILARAQQAAATGEIAYLDAVAKEALRIRPVIPGVGRVVREQPFGLGQWVIPVGVEINPSIRVIHRRPDLYPAPDEFRPERFLDAESSPDTYSWVPFGGGTRRCLGASFALMEMRLILQRVLTRTRLEPVSGKLDRVQFRAITLAPRDGVRVLQRQPPLPS
jgi:cytochrome P450